ncbi:MAG: M20 family metallopeptidase [Anaerolineae bacterium]
MAEILDYFQSRNEEMLALLRRLVEMESPTTEKAAMDRFGAFLSNELRNVGAAISAIGIRDYGDHLLAQWGEGKGQILVLMHMDTVYPLGELDRRPFRLEDDLAYGPGIYDMKGGVAITLFALRGLRELGLSTKKQVTILCNSDEEVGSPTSRELIEVEAMKSDYVLVMEPAASPEGALKTSRKGVGRFDLIVTGRAAHAGVNHELGRSAIEELAHQILRLHSLTDYEAGITLNVGLVEGGTRSNVVADWARAEVDLRVATLKQGERMVQQILSLQPVTPDVTLKIVGGLNRPPMERTPEIVALFQRAKRLGTELGLELSEGSSGGGSDGNFTAALGVPTLDGLGAIGDGAHSPEEHILVKRLPERAALLAKLLQELD